ncbi:MAG TPA: hypothetical protein VNQ73_13150 [Ilumatobacter sp.]|nr:hypothetical protein [Ilumatobacter sp.]
MTGTAPTTGALDVRLPAPGWAVLDAVRARAFTGEVTLIGSPAVRLWADHGRIYLAEQLGEPPLAARLAAGRVLTADDVTRGVVRVADRQHLGALFERVPGADRHAVQVAVAAYTEDALRTIAGQLLAGIDVVPYAFDPNGVHAWGQPAPPPAPPPVGPPVNGFAPPPAPFAAPLAGAAPAPQPTPPAPSQAAPEPTLPTSTPAPAAPEPTLPPSNPRLPDVPPPPAAAAQPEPASAATATTTATAELSEIDWDRLPFLDQLADEREGRGTEPFSVIWPDGDVERRSSTNGAHTNGAGVDDASSIAGVPAGTRTRLLDDRFGPL